MPEKFGDTYRKGMDIMKKYYPTGEEQERFLNTPEGSLYLKLIIHSEIDKIFKKFERSVNKFFRKFDCKY
ncbi:MAG: hypothetical protein KKF48_02045 [Nanoarchaeota archaeon]|nr:hypothetical protein [Nanoarchaeota archaeon]MBU1027802.1 hypothetical protein [Nanoarchaeota archaeon]